MKNLARQYCYWPGLDKDIELLAKNCSTCVQKLPAPPKVWHPWNYPEGPWCRLHIDYAEFEGVYLLIIVDAYSKWLEVFPTSKMTSTATINFLRETFARFGLPKLIVSDNGPQFTSNEFAVFLARNGIKHVFSAPFHANSNGQAERYVRTVKEGLKADQRGSIRDRLARILLAFRRAPSATTLVSPAELMLKWTPRTRLDLLRQPPDDKIRYTPSSKPFSRPPYQPGDAVYYRSFGTDKWRAGELCSSSGMTHTVADSSTGALHRRHVDQLHKGPSSTTPPLQHPPSPTIPATSAPLPTSASPDRRSVSPEREPSTSHPSNEPAVEPRRSSRTRRPPASFGGEEMWCT